jgi:ribonuclease R
MRDNDNGRGGFGRGNEGRRDNGGDRRNGRNENRGYQEGRSDDRRDGGFGRRDDHRGGFGHRDDRREGGFGGGRREGGFGHREGGFGGRRDDRRGGFGGGARPMRRDSNPVHVEDENELECSVIRFFMQNKDNAEINRRQVSEGIRAARREDEERIDDTLEHLVHDKFILNPVPGKYQFNPEQELVAGTLARRPRAKVVLVPEGAENVDGADEIYIADENMNHAMVGDTVRIRKFNYKVDGQAAGQVVSVDKRGRETFVGILDVSPRFAFLKVDKRACPNDIFIPADKLKDGQSGQKALVRLVGWNDRDKNPNGEVIDVLGEVGDNNTEMNAILAEFGLPYDYPQEVTDYANTLSGEVTAADLAERVDYRPYTTFTVDPKDAKDFDDALSIRKLDNGNWEIGVHIADVTHFVKEGDIMDQEAVNRATSVYLVDRTIPMLPECISNELCSLRPDEDKFTYSVLFELDDNANMLKYKICHALIRSNRRFCYEEAQERIETGKGDYAEEILAMDRLAKLLRKRRFENGAIAFEKEEIKFDLDEKGKPIRVYSKISKDANKMIEEFMLLANKTVATHIGKVKENEHAKTFVYRIHENPDPDKLSQLAEFIGRFAYHIKTEGKGHEISSSINQLLSDVRGKKEQNLIETIAVRSMQKAIYSTTNVGHYGLAFDYYTHFTSPIRRYPDMMVHRLLDRYAAGLPSADRAKYDELCEHSSAQEQLAANAERASIKYKMVEFMGDKVGESFLGVISGIQEWGPLCGALRQQVRGYGADTPTDR